MRFSKLTLQSKAGASLLVSCSLLSVTLTLNAQNLSTVVFPTEEELFEAFTNNEISFDEYITLLDIFSSAGLDASDTLEILRVLGADFPNLDFIAGLNSADFDSLQAEQMDALLGTPGARRAWRGKVRMYSDQEFTGERRTQSNYKLALNYRDQWKLRGAIGGTYTQQAVWKSRSLTYYPETSPVSSVTIGTFDYRPALGLALGRRGRLVERPEPLGNDFSLTTDRGGFDGAIVEGKFFEDGAADAQWNALYSRRSDTAHVISLSAGELGARVGDISFSSITTYGQITRRSDDANFIQWQQSFGAGWRNPGSTAQLEVNTQSNDGRMATALALESRIRSGAMSARLALWSYPSAYRNLFGSGRSGLLSQTVDIESVGLTFSDRRIAQTGALIRARLKTGSRANIEADIDIAHGENDERRNEYTLGYAREIGAPGELTLEARYRERKTEPATLTRTIVRLQLAGSSALYRWRLALRAYDEESGEQGAGVFARIRRTLPRSAQLDLWLDLSRWEPSGDGLRRFYGYLRFATPLEKTGALAIANKFAYRYDRRSAITSRIVYRIELEARW